MRTSGLTPPGGWPTGLLGEGISDILEFCSAESEDITEAGRRKVSAAIDHALSDVDGKDAFVRAGLRCANKHRRSEHPRPAGPSSQTLAEPFKNPFPPLEATKSLPTKAPPPSYEAAFVKDGLR